MSQDYSPSLVTKNLVFCGDAAMKSAAGPATLLYDKVNDNNGTMYNGSCVDFDGTDDYVDNTSFTSHQVDSGTIVVWANPRSIGSDGYVLSVGGAATLGANRCIRDTSGKWSLVTYGSGGTEDYNNFGPSIVTGQWYHLAFVWSGTSATAYVDGVAYSTTLSGMITPAGTVMAVGRAPWSTSSGTSRFDGQAADARVYNVALSAANIKELYDDSKVIVPTKNDASGGFVTQTNLIGWWPLGDGAGTIAYDGSGNGNDGTLTNMTSADWLTGQTGAPQLVEGYNRAMLFGGSGSGDNVKVGSQTSSNMLPTAAVTVCGWAYSPIWSSMSDKRVYSNTEAGGMSLGPRIDGRTDSLFIIRTNLSGGSYSYGTGADTQTFSNNTWHHLAATFDGRYIKQYFDGVLKGTADLGSTYTIQYPTTFSTFFGDECDGTTAAGTRNFDGIINEVIVYSKALDAADLLKLAATDANGGPLPPDPYGVSYATSGVSSSNIGGYWRNDGNVTWTDRSGNGYTGTVAGSPSALLFKQGYNGQKNVNTGRDNQGFPLKFKNVGAVGFNGSNDYVALTSRALASEFTISMWINPDDVTGVNLLGLSSATTDYLWINSSSEVDLKSSDIDIEFTDSNITAGVWQHICITRDGSDIPKFYKDGVSIQTLAADAGTFTFDQMGRYYDGGNVNWFDGQIANVRIYNRALTYAEIQQNYNSFKSRFGK